MTKKISLGTFLKSLSLHEYITYFGSYWDRNEKKFKKFKLWPRQIEFCEFLEREFLTIDPKARQQGVSEIAAERSVKECMQSPNTEILIISKTEDDAIYFLEYRVKRKIKNLPSLDGLIWPTVVKDTNTMIKLSNGSTIRSLTSAQTSGASMSADAIIFDEAGGIDERNGNFKQLFANAYPVLTHNKNAWCMIIGTSVPGSYYNELVRDAFLGKNDEFKMFFFSCFDVPGRDDAWYDSMCKKLKEDIYLQQPRTIEEFFFVKEGLVFKGFDSREEGLHVKLFEPNFIHEFYVVYDHGYRHPAGALFGLYDQYEDILYIYDEVYFEQDHQSEIEDIAKPIKMKIFQARKKPKKMIADTAIFNKTNGLLTTAKLFKRQGLKFSKSIKHNEKASRDLVVSRLTHCKIVVHPQCYNLIDEFRNHRWNAKSNKETTEDKNNDLLDALRYLCAELVQKDRPRPPEETIAFSEESKRERRRRQEELKSEMTGNISYSRQQSWQSA